VLERRLEHPFEFDSDVDRWIGGRGFDQHLPLVHSGQRRTCVRDVLEH
jgi:hypothetical protein